MKKLISFLICINILNINCAFAFSNALVDEFANQTIDKNLKIKFEKQEPIEDIFAKQTLNPNLKITYPCFKPIYDNFAHENLNRNVKLEKIIPKPITDALTQKAKISPSKVLTTRKLHEGQIVEFKLKQDLKINEKIYPANSIIKARIENISKNEAFGVPSELIIDNFILADNVKLDGQISKCGANRAIWIYPTSTILYPFFGIDLLLLPIRGGHAKLKPSKIYEIEINN